MYARCKKFRDIIAAGGDRAHFESAKEAESTKQKCIVDATEGKHSPNSPRWANDAAAVGKERLQRKARAGKQRRNNRSGKHRARGKRKLKRKSSEPTKLPIEVEISEVHHVTYKRLLEYIYTGNLRINSLIKGTGLAPPPMPRVDIQETVQLQENRGDKFTIPSAAKLKYEYVYELMAISHRYKMPLLKSLCEAALIKHTNVDNVVEMFMVSDDCCAHTLKEFCLEVILSHYKTLAHVLKARLTANQLRGVKRKIATAKLSI